MAQVSVNSDYRRLDIEENDDVGPVANVTYGDDSLMSLGAASNRTPARPSANSMISSVSREHAQQPPSGNYSNLPVPLGSQGRSLSHRMFGPVTEGSMRGTIATIIITIIGAGILSLPYAVRVFGLIPGILLLIFSAYLAYFTLDLLLIAVENARVPDGQAPSYAMLADATGIRGLSKLAQVAIMIQFLGISVGYFVTAGGLIDLTYNVLGGKGNVYVYSVVILALGLVWPLAMMKSVSKLRFTSLLGFVCCMYLGVTLFVEYFLLCDDLSVRHNGDTTPKSDEYSSCFWKGSQFKLSADQLFPVASGWETFATGFLTAFPLCVFGFTCHQSMLNVYRGLNNRNRRRMGKVNSRSLLVSLIIYIMASSAGFLTFLDGTCSNILLNNFKQQAQVIIAALAISVSVSMTQPVFAITFRENFSTLVWGTDHIESRWAYHAVTFAYVAVAAVLALTVTDIATVFGLLGSTTYPIVGYVLPAVFYCKLVKPGSHGYNQTRRSIAILQACLVTLSSLCSLGNQIYGMVSDSTSSCSNEQSIVS